MASSVTGFANPVLVCPWLSYAVVLKMPRSVDNSDPRKQFFGSVCPDSAEISELRKSKQDWKLCIKSKSSAERTVEK